MTKNQMKFIKWRRKHFNSNAEMSKQTGISEQAISDWMNGRREVGSILLWAMSLFNRIIDLEKTLKKSEK